MVWESLGKGVGLVHGVTESGLIQGIPFSRSLRASALCSRVNSINTRVQYVKRSSIRKYIPEYSDTNSFFSASLQSFFSWEQDEKLLERVSMRKIEYVEHWCQKPNCFSPSCSMQTVQQGTQSDLSKILYVVLFYYQPPSLTSSFFAFFNIFLPFLPIPGFA